MSQKQKEIDDIIDALKELEVDSTVPRNVRAKMGVAIAALKGCEELCIGKDKALQELDDIANDTNTQPYTRTQIWNIISLLESL